MVMITITNYANNYASTTYQSLEGAKKNKKQKKLKNKKKIMSSPDPLPAPSEEKWLTPNEAFVIVISLFFVRHGIRCYQCVSVKSWDDCDPGNVTTCSNSSSCLQFEFDAEIPNEGTYRVFQKECTIKSVCNEDICKRFRQASSTVRKCDFECCESDLCNRNIWTGSNGAKVPRNMLNGSNGAKVPIVSGFLFLVCVFFIF